MATHRVTLTLSHAAYERLQAVRASRQLESEDEVVEQVLAEVEDEKYSFDSRAGLEQWIQEVVLPAEEEDKLHPETECTLEEFKEAFWLKHGRRLSA